MAWHQACPRSVAAQSFDETFDATWTRNPLDVRSIWRAAAQIRQVVTAGKYDLVHVHTPIASFVTRYALRGLRRRRQVRVVYTAHGFHFSPELPAFRNAVFIAAEKLAGRWTDELVVINSDDLRAARRYRFVEPSHLRLIHGIGVDTERFNPANIPPGAIGAVRSELGIEDSPLVVMVAEFTPNKHHDRVLEALSLTRSGVHLAFAGEGPTMHESRERASRLGLQNRTHFLGYRTDVPTLIAASMATVLFSAREGLPRSSMESLAMAVPVVGADIRGLRDLLADGCGVLVSAGDTGALALAIDRLVEDPATARQMGLLGRRKMEGDYSLRAVIAEHECLYADALEDS